MKMFFNISLFFLLLSPFFSQADNSNNNFSTVTLQLKWKHQFQFAGYYAAIAKGYYLEAGIQVNLLEAEEGVNPNETVLSGRADFGISNSEIIRLREKNKNLVVLASIFQHSPTILVSMEKSNIKHVRDIVGKKIAVDPNSCEIIAFLNSEGVSRENCTVVPQTFDILQFLNGEVDVLSAYSTDETFALEEAGVSYSVLSPIMSGIDFYGDILYTTSDLIQKEPELVSKFRKASMEGWKYAMSHQDEIIELIYSKYSQRLSKAYLKHEADHMKSLIMGDVVEIGYSNPERWDHILNLLKNLNLVSKSQTIAGLLYDENRLVKKEIPWGTIIPFLLIILVISLVTYFFYNSFRKLKKAEARILKANRFYEFISHINQSIVLIKNKTKLLDEVCRISIEIGKFKMSWIGFIDDETKIVQPLVFAGEENGYLSVMKKISLSDVPEGRGPTGTAIREGKHFVCEDIKNDPRMVVWKGEALSRGYYSSIAVPLKNRGNVTGAFSLYSGEPYFFDAEEIDLLNEVANNLSFALDAIDKDQELKDFNTNLEIKIANRTNQLVEANKILQTEIEERIRVENALVESEQKYKTVVDNISEVIFYTDTDGLWVFLNNSWTEITGYSLEESIGQPFVNYVFPDDRAYNMELFLPLIRKEKEYCHHAVRYVTKEGGFRWIEVFARLNINAIGEVIGTYGTLRDITAEKLANEFENELLQMSPQLTGLPLAEIDNALNFSLSRIGQFLKADRAYIFEFNPDLSTMTNTFEWCNDGIQPEIENLKDVPCEVLPNWMAKLTKLENIIIPSVKDLPGNWQAERDILEPQGIQSLIVIPMLSENKLIGFVGLDAVRSHKEYAPAEINILTVWSSMLASLINNKRSDLLLQITRQNYETFFNTIDDFLWVLDEQGNIIHVNSTVQNRLGYSTEELLNQSVMIVHPVNRREEAGRIVGEMLAGKADFCPVPVVSKSGIQIPVETRVKAGYWNNQPVIFGVSKDISKLELSEHKFSTAFRFNSAMMSIANFQDGKFIDINHAFTEALGYSREEVIGKSGNELRIFVDPNTRLEIVASIKNNISIREKEILIRAKDGTIKTGIISSDLIYIGDDACLLSVVIDISERIRAEEEIRKARFEAERANLAKSEFLSRMSHELRTPMNSILGFAQLLNMGELNSGQRKGVKHIMRSGKHLLDLINEVLDISRIEAGQLSLSLEPIQIDGVIKEVIEIVSQQAHEKAIEIDFVDSDANNLFVKSDKQRLKQILLNLLNNAIKYNNKGGKVVLSASVNNGQEMTNTQVRISISDSGQGISPEDLPKLFNPFERIGAEKTETEGTGLGLSVVKKLVEAMGGMVGVESEPGQGSTFWVDFPLAEEVSLQKLNKGELASMEFQLENKSGVIVYIEDNPANVELIEEILLSQRTNVRLVSNAYGLNAVPLAIEVNPSLIFLDLNLPDIHGSEALLMLQANEKTKNIPVVIISADAMPQQIERLMASGAKKYLTKPLDLTLLLKIIDEYIA